MYTGVLGVGVLLHVHRSTRDEYTTTATRGRSTTTTCTQVYYGWVYYYILYKRELGVDLILQHVHRSTRGGCSTTTCTQEY